MVLYPWMYVMLGAGFAILLHMFVQTMFAPGIMVSAVGEIACAWMAFRAVRFYNRR